MIKSFVLNKYISKEFTKITFITIIIFFSLGFIMNQMHPGITAWKTATDVADSVYSNL